MKSVKRYAALLLALALLPLAGCEPRTLEGEASDPAQAQIALFLVDGGGTVGPIKRFENSGKLAGTLDVSAQDGMVDEEGGWVYYRSYGEGDGALVRSTADFSNTQTLMPTAPDCYTVVGNTLYSVQRGQGIYACDTDGRNKKILLTTNIGNDPFWVEGDTIYYSKRSSLSQEWENDGCIWKFECKSGRESMLCDLSDQLRYPLIKGVVAGELIVCDDYPKENGRGGSYAVDLHTGKERELPFDGLVLLDGEHLFYCNIQDSYYLYEADRNGGEGTRLLDSQGNPVGPAVNSFVFDGGIYYCEDSDYQGYRRYDLSSHQVWDMPELSGVFLPLVRQNASPYAGN